MLKPILFVSVLLCAGFFAACTSKPNCPSGLTDCKGVCVDTKTDRQHCGACETACEAGMICDGAGKCGVSCQAGLLDCGGVCTDPKTDRMHCGATATCAGDAAGKSCADGEICQAGACTLQCPTSQVACGGKCIDPLTDRQHCGAKATCGGADAGTACADGEICDAGACVIRCPAGEIACGGKCIDPTTDRAHCGAKSACTGDDAGTVCGEGTVCSAGSCLATCGTGLVTCGNTCVDPLTSTGHCGAGADCTTTPGTDCAATTAANAIGYCSAGACAIRCAPGFADCDGVAANGCEVKGSCSGACAYRDAEHPSYTTPAQDVALCGATYTSSTYTTACNPGWHVCTLGEWTARFPAGSAPGGLLSTFGADQTVRCTGGYWEANRPTDGQIWTDSVCSTPGNPGDGAYNPWNNIKMLLSDDGKDALEGSGGCCDWDQTFAKTDQTDGYAVYCCRSTP